MNNKSIVRVCHDKNNPYVVINSLSLRHKMSWGATGLLTYMLTYKDDWQFHLSKLAELKGESLHTTRKYIKELIDKGFAIRFQENNPKRSDMQYLIFESSMPLKNRIDFIKERFVNPYFPDFQKDDIINKKASTDTFGPHCEKPRAEIPHADFLGLSNINLKDISKEQQPIEKKTPAAVVVSPHIFKCLKDVDSLTEKQKATLCTKFSEERLIQAVEFFKNEPYTKTAMAAFIWHCKLDDAPEHTKKLTPEEKIKKNREIANSFHKIYMKTSKKNQNIIFEVLNSGCEITYLNCQKPSERFDFNKLEPEKMQSVLENQLKKLKLI